MERIYVEYGSEPAGKLLEKNRENLIFKDKNGSDISVGNWVVYSERMYGKYNYADSLGYIVNHSQYGLHIITRVYNKGGHYEELPEGSSSEDPAIDCHQLEFYEGEGFLEVHVKDLELVSIHSEEIDDLIEFMDEKMPLYGESN